MSQNNSHHNVSWFVLRVKIRYENKVVKLFEILNFRVYNPIIKVKKMNLEKVKISVIGQGYVGLPLAIEFGKKYPTVGFDINANRIDELKTGIDHTNEATPEQISSAKQLTFSPNIKDITECNIYIVTVPTPIDEYKTPDLNPLKGASKMLGEILKKGDIVIYESTVYPGCTEEVCVPLLEEASGLIFNTDFYCGYSPERIVPGDKVNTLTTIKKVTSGSTSGLPTLLTTYTVQLLLQVLLRPQV